MVIIDKVDVKAFFLFLWLAVEVYMQVWSSMEVAIKRAENPPPGHISVLHSLSVTQLQHSEIILHNTHLKVNFCTSD